ncbi:DUF1760-domain-containing protein [Microthyrium microscopicum]|uniref:DUF1760-domain-containing protein n=1 Tax=Microthyrium microscopicum TaxID=703497 RepID=A0A6A6UGL5_9PEZI|nr:DUF1760-domain-containing protein [Microthyrium microscopicum]
MASSEDALLALRPPNTDPATYLTYVEQNLTKDRLPVLHDVLQDPDLTDSIGWDLVSTLLPLLPESRECLMVVARGGNPKEVVLKVTECLRSIDFEAEELGEEHDGDKTPTADEPGANGSAGTAPLPLLQFQTLVQMLSTLHPRIQAKAPSRFLSSSLQAILAAYATASHYHDVLTMEIVKFIKTLTGTKRPHFPPRRSSSAVLLATLATNPVFPEAYSTPQIPESARESEEDRIQRKLLQSFLTHMLDEYMQSLPAYDDIAGLAWCSRFWEKTENGYIIPSKVSVTDRFSNSAELENRLTTVGQLVAIAQDLEIHSDDLLATMLDTTPEIEGDRGVEESYPSTAASIPLSKSGALYLFTARKAMEVIYDGPGITDNIPIFPGHALLARVFIENVGEDGVRNTPDPLLDALLFVGLIALDQNNVGEPKSDEHFAAYLQATSLLSATVMSPTIRFHAHYLTTTVLRSHPKDVTRLRYIQDTLEHCPFENLKASAVSWIKGETIDANTPKEEDSLPSIFATPQALQILAPYLWPDISSTYSFSHSDSTPVADPEASYNSLMANYGFYAASLNFLLLLLKSTRLHKPLAIQYLVAGDGEILSTFVRPLHEAVGHFETLDKLEGETGEDGVVMELGILKMLTDEVESEVKKQGWAAAGELAS